MYASASTTIKFHDCSSRNVVLNYQPTTKLEGPIRSISWSRDGTWLALVPHSGHTEIIGIKDQLKLLKTIQDIEEPTCACFQNTTKKNVVLGSKSGLVVIYDVKSRCVKKRFPRASSQIVLVDFIAKDTHCVAGCINGEVLVYGNITNSPPSVLRVPKSSTINCLKTNQAKRQLVLGGSNEGVVVVWDINVSKRKFFVEAHKSPVNAVAFSPVNTDLIVSAGSDRQFSFYDIVDHQCIASVAVENSITSVDFSPDGTYFVMASQNGKVHTYDSRNIQVPVHSFQAHSSAIKHLAFQHVQVIGNSSPRNISTDSTTPIPSTEGNGNRSSTTSNLSGLFVPNIESVEDGRRSVGSMEGTDSFIDALGLDKNNTTESVKQEDGIPQFRGRLSSIVDVPSPSPSLSLATRRLTGGFKENRFASTPKRLSVDINTEISPVVDKRMLGNFANASEVRAVVKEELDMVKKELVIVKKELEGKFKGLQADIQYQGIHTISELKSLLYNMHMVYVKDSIKQEDFNDQIMEYLKNMKTGSNPNHNWYYTECLVEENEQLRKKIKFLEEQLKQSRKGDGISD